MFNTALRKRFFIVLCLLIISAFGCPLFAVTAESDGSITLDTVTAQTGDTVTVNVNIVDNPGIMAVTVSIKYDSSALTYIRYFKGILNDYTVYNHIDKGIIRLVSCGSADNKRNGTLIGLQFKVNETAGAGLHKISLEYSSGDFCNWDEQLLMPTVSSGGVNIVSVEKNCENHTYGEWKKTALPTCTDSGTEQRFCTACGHCETKSLAALGHDYEEFWTVDIQAVADTAGRMSRHCRRCSETTDIISFTSSEAEENKIENKSGVTVKPNDFTGEITEPVKAEETEASNSSDASAKKISGDRSDKKALTVAAAVCASVLIIGGSAVVITVIINKKISKR